jgi:ubiquinone/menaquinone biosynthesis C-methylase UbiE
MQHEFQTRAAYNALHQQDELRFPKEDYAHFCSWLNIPSDARGLRLLDIACGQGFFLESVEQRHSEIELYGIDFSPVAIEKARFKLNQAQIAEASVYHMPFADKVFDYIVNLGSLEHFDRPVDSLRELHRVLKPSGKAMVIVPNQYYLGNIWRVLAYGEEDDQGQEGMTRFHTVTGWESQFREAGLDPIAVKGYNGEDHIAWYFKRRCHTISEEEKRYRHILETFVKPLIPLNLSHCFVFFLRRQPGEHVSNLNAMNAEKK